MMRKICAIVLMFLIWLALGGGIATSTTSCSAAPGTCLRNSDCVDGDTCQRGRCKLEIIPDAAVSDATPPVDTTEPDAAAEAGPSDAGDAGDVGDAGDASDASDAATQ